MMWAIWRQTEGRTGHFVPGLGAKLLGDASEGVTYAGAVAEDLECHVPAALSYLNANTASPPGRTLRVNGGPTAARDLQAALNAAAPGDIVELQAGASFVGHFILPEKRGSAWVVIKSSGETGLPPQGSRITPANAASLPKIITPNADAAIKTAPRAHHFRLVGVEIGVAPGVAQNHGLVLLGDGSGAQRSMDVVPHDLTLDRCYVHGNGTGELRRGVALNSARTTVVDSYIAACQGLGYDTQAIAGWNGPGPFKIVNNHLEGAGENVMFGGADPAIPNLVPSDIEFRNNYCTKPLTWKAGQPGARPQSVKNLFELKNARRVLVDGNVFEHNWADAQSGFAILLTVRNQDGGAPWSVVGDVVFSNNVVRSVGAAFNLLGRDYNHPSLQLRRVRIEQNLFEDIGGSQWGGNGCFLQMTETACIVVDSNTIFHTGNVIAGYGQPSTDFAFTNNVARNNEYGVTGDGVGSGRVALDKYFPASLFTGNVLVGGRKELYPAGNYFPLALDGGGVQSTGSDVDLLRNRIAKVRAGN
jgi:hypothetical protein